MGIGGGKGGGQPPQEAEIPGPPLWPKGTPPPGPEGPPSPKKKGPKAPPDIGEIG